MIEEKTAQKLSGFWIKVLAFLFMTLDHIGLFLLANPANQTVYNIGYVFRVIGRISLPLILLLAAEGARHTRNIWKYFVRLMIMHVGISAFMTVFVYAAPQFGLTIINAPANAFADLSILVLTIACLKQKRFLKLLALLPFSFVVMVYVLQMIEKSQSITIYWLPTYLRPDYSLFGLFIGLGFYYSRPIAAFLSKPILANAGISMDVYQESKQFQRMVNIVSMCLLFFVTVIFWGISYIGWNFDYRPYDTYSMQGQSYCLLALIPMFFYSGTRGYDSKAMRIATYFYYPVHIAILFLIFSL